MLPWFEAAMFASRQEEMSGQADSGLAAIVLAAESAP
jgi:hypothetical protein